MYTGETDKLLVMKAIRKEAKIGIFTVVILVLLYFGINFLKGRDLFNKSMTYYAYYDNVNGIKVSSPIIIKGINAGTVTGITYRPDMDGDVELRFTVKSSYRIPENSVAKLFTNGIMGGKALEIVLGNSTEYLPDGATIRSENETSVFDLAGSELDYFKQKLDGLINSLDNTLTGINSLLNDNSAQIAGTFEGLRQSVAAFGAKGEDIKEIIDSINEIMRTVADNSERIDTAISNFESVSNELAEAGLANTVSNLDSVLLELDATLASLNSTNGSLGKLMNDTALYDSLTQASANLASLLEDLKANPKRYVHFSVFGRKE